MNTMNTTATISSALFNISDNKSTDVSFNHVKTGDRLPEKCPLNKLQDINNY